MAEERCRHERPALQPTAVRDMVRCPFSTHELSNCLHRSHRSGQAGNGWTRQTASFDSTTWQISYAKPGVVDQFLGRRPKATPTVDEIDLTIRRGETVGLVGESGKRQVDGPAGHRRPLVLRAGGTITYAGSERLNHSVDERAKGLLRRIQLIFQNPDNSLNPRHTVADILAQPLKLYFDLSGDELRERSVALLDRVRLRADYLGRLPGQLSGGEKQRVAVARAFAAEPELVLCDEVTSALDVSVQAVVLNLLRQLQADRGTTYLFVSHDLAVVRSPWPTVWPCSTRADSARQVLRKRSFFHPPIPTPKCCSTQSSSLTRTLDRHLRLRM